MLNIQKLRDEVFEPPFGGSGTYDVHFGLIGKRIVDFLLVLIELFSLRVTAESLRAKIDRKSAIANRWVSIHQIFALKGKSHTNHFGTDS